ncbi:PilC/PilY family type IV pilus protein [Pseudoalteromonas sp. 2CM39R]|uniref:PilC/PilY family type IV pilus protein n=1 Tax=Pseudoalteromonas sp. 2CM39R TaxID=2929856 RepID=UPI0020BDA994|nr:PilC/PilY family type IV pilus protein [Pseudoalteromonas sp. 2CM39R]MCK8126066.1 PilC/PilY family type IV pilus protein [Pseudoalteromonas sp. 2CM39R]
MKMKLNSLFFIFACVFCQNLYAEDIDLYVNYDVAEDEKLRVLLVFDTSNSMAFSIETGKVCRSKGKLALCPEGSRLEVAQEAMITLINDNSDIEFGLMRLIKGTGGYVIHGIGTSHKKIKNTIRNWDVTSLQAGTPLVETITEGWRYLTGDEISYANLVDPMERDISIEQSGKYISPFKQYSGDPIRCDNSVNIILMTDGEPYWDVGQDDYIKRLYKSIYGTEPEAVGKSHLPSMATILHGKKNENRDIYPETSVIDGANVYTIGFGKGLSKNAGDILQATADNGGGDYIFAESPEELSKAFNNVLTDIREVNSTFSSPSVASNNSDKLSHRDAVYFPMFLPSNDARWRGNLKKLKVSGGSVVDANSKIAVDSDGAILSTAKTFWSEDTALPDGNIVQSGGVNAYLAKQNSIALARGSRKIISNLKDDIIRHFRGLSIMAFYGTVGKAAAAFGDPSLRVSDIYNLSNWSRGIDIYDEDGDGDRRETREDVFGDPLHSKPVTIDYGKGDVRILIGTNAGYLHMFKDKNDVLKESWAFIPRSLYKIIKPLRDKEKRTKVYGVDGPISIFFDDKDNDGVVNGSDRVWAFFGLRRGGNEYYALNITNPNKPALMWGGPLVGGTGDFKELAQTWSKPQVTYINLKGYENRPLLVFGAGYDTNKDNSISADSKGRGLYIVDAQTGKRLWALTNSEGGFKGEHSIASDIHLLDSDYDGYTDRLYASDTGGGVWRVDLATNNKKNWTHFQLAKLGNNNRRFFYEPYVSRTLFSKVTETTLDGEKTYSRIDTPFDAVLIGSGDRTDPFNLKVNDKLYMIRDVNTVTRSFEEDEIPDLIWQSDLMNVDSDPFAKVTDSLKDFVELEADLAEKDGWYFNLGWGEKATSKATVLGGVAYFTTYKPDTSSSSDSQCSIAEGQGYLYAFHLHYGTKVYDWRRTPTAAELPDTPTMYVEDGEVFILQLPNEDSNCTTNCKKTAPKVINGPSPSVDENGNVQLYDEEPLKLEVHQSYIYKQEKNDNSS